MSVELGPRITPHIERLLLGGALAGALACGFYGFRTAHTRLALPVERALAAALGLSPSAVHVGRAELRAPATLLLEEVRAGALSAKRIELDADLSSLLHARARLGRARVHELIFAGVGQVASLELTSSDGTVHLVAHDLSGRLRGVPLAAADLALDFVKGRLERAAAAQLRAYGVDELALHAFRDGDTFRFRAARRGLDVDGRAAGGRVSLSARLEQLPLVAFAPLARVLGGDLERAQATGELEVERSGGELSSRGRLRIEELVFDQPALAPRRLGPLAIDVSGELRLRDALVIARELHVRLGPVAVRAEGYVDARDFELAASLEPVGCAEALRALPGDLLPALDGLTLEGELAGRVRLAGELEHLADLTLDSALQVGCRVLDDPPLADATKLLAKTALDQRPSFRRLAALPKEVVHAFVVAEDGRFFHHHGFDADMIRRALAQDLATQKFERGASTITQQVAKNLFLSGERTAARKLEEAVLAWRVEQVVPKRRILELYMNLAELGPGTFGIADAAERYFGKEAEELSSDEGAQLAALLPAPRRGMDVTWERRYRALVARLPSEEATPTLATLR